VHLRGPASVGSREPVLVGLFAWESFVCRVQLRYEGDGGVPSRPTYSNIALPVSALASWCWWGFFLARVFVMRYSPANVLLSRAVISGAFSL
jgi:hypothetical protein